MSRISIVVPCRNGEKWLAQTLRSALNQTLAAHEIIVVNDGSTDNSREIAQSFEPYVRVIEGSAQGAAVARNRGAGEASGERIMFLDADDLITPPTLAALSDALDTTDVPAFAICPWDRYEARDFGWIATPPTAALPRPGQDRLANWLTGSWSPPCCILWDRETFDLTGGWLQEAGLDDDGNLVRRALARGVRGVDAPGGLGLYRRLPGEGVSYSGKRLEPFGLRSRLVSLRDTVVELESAGTLADYRLPLEECLSDLLADSRAHPEIAADVRSLVSRVGITETPDPLRRRAGILSARGSAWLRERTALRVKTQPIALTGPVAEADSRLVSVIVPTYNRARLAERSVKSILAQTHEELEVIVVDDGSTDDTQSRLSAIGDPRIRLLHQENAGVAEARNRGIREAKGAYLSFLDSDDEWLPRKLEMQISALNAAPRYVGMCLTGGQVITDSGLGEPNYSPQGYLFEQLLEKNTVFACMYALVRREVFDAVGGHDPSLPAIEDWEWLQRAARLYAFVSIDESLAIYHDEGKADRRSRRFDANMLARDMLWQRNRHGLRRAGLAQSYLLESARRELREEAGSGSRGRRSALRAFWERPQNALVWPWFPYMMAPRAVRTKLRRLDAKVRNLKSG